MKQHKFLNVLREYAILTVATIIMAAGIYIFKFPNNFSFGGVTGIAILLARFGHFSAATYNLILNMVVLIFGFIFLGKSFGIKTVYISVLSSALISGAELVWPLTEPLTNEPMLELLFAIVLPAASSAILFNMGASGGGTDVIAMILKKYTSANIGTSLFIVDLIITIGSVFAFDVTTGLFSFTGLLAKSLVIDGVIENINLCKYFTIICDNPEPICDFITNELHKSATIFKATGAYEHTDKTIILSVMKRSQAVALRNFIKKEQPKSFILITNSSEIIGKGFRGFN